MKTLKTITSVLFLFILGHAASAQKWVTPVIQKYGHIKIYPTAELQPDKNLDFKMVFNLTKGAEKDGVNIGLWHIARELNLLGATGIKPKHIHLVGVIHGEATPIILSNKAYRKRTGKPNPNLALLSDLTAHGVLIYVCGQAAADANIDPATEMNTYIHLSVSALIDLPEFQLKGYALIP